MYMESVESIIELKTRHLIYQIISKYPGMHLRGIIKKSKLSEGTVRYHLQYLKRKDLIKTDSEAEHHELTKVKISVKYQSTTFGYTADGPQIQIYNYDTGRFKSSPQLGEYEGKSWSNWVSWEPPNPSSYTPRIKDERNYLDVRIYGWGNDCEHILKVKVELAYENTPPDAPDAPKALDDKRYTEGAGIGRSFSVNLPYDQEDDYCHVCFDLGSGIEELCLSYSNGVATEVLSWDSEGIYEVRAKAIEYSVYKTSNLESEWSDPVEIKVGNDDPIATKITGPVAVKTGKSYTYSAESTDDGDQVRYGWSWDGGLNVDEWGEFGKSSINHEFKSAGDCTIRVIAQDEWGAMHDPDHGQNWKSLPVVVSKTKLKTSINSPFMDFFIQHSFLQRLLDLPFFSNLLAQS